MKTTIEAFRDFYVALGGSLNDVKNIVTIPAMIEVLNQVTQLGNLTNVALNSPSDGQVLTYDGTAGKWKNADLSGGGSFVVTVTEDSGTYSVDKTLAEINDALEDGLLPIAIYDADGFHNVYNYAFGDSTQVALFIQTNPVYNDSMLVVGYQLKTLLINVNGADITYTTYSANDSQGD